MKEQNKIGLVAGPCSAENRMQMLETARGLKNIGVNILRAGLWKPRSRYGTFEGVGERGLVWLNEIQQELGMKVMTEVALPAHVEVAMKAGVDMVWIGARTTVNPFMMHELAEALRGFNIPVWIKNPISPDIELWLGAVERLQHSDVQDIRVIHRGFCTIDSAPYRNAPLWECLDGFRAHFPNIPFYCDPSHILLENVNYWLQFARKHYLCMWMVCLLNRTVVHRKLYRILLSSLLLMVWLSCCIL